MRWQSRQEEGQPSEQAHAWGQKPPHRGCFHGGVVTLWLFLILLGALEDARAQEPPAGPTALQEEQARRAFDTAIIEFNTGIQRFPTWDAFAAALAEVRRPDARGTCYAHSGGRVQVTPAALPPPAAGPPWQQTAGGGWRQQRPDRTVVEYRFNAATNAVLWSVGVHPRWFFAYTTQLCVLPLEGPRPGVWP